MSFAAVRPGEKFRPERAAFLPIVNERGDIRLCVGSVIEGEQQLGLYRPRKTASREGMRPAA